MNIHNRKLVLSSLFTALIAAGAIFSLPLPPPLPPVTLAVFFALLAGLVAGPVWGSAAVGLYLFLGSIGLPVFANGTGGLGHFSGPTGGFLVGYLGLALVAGLMADRRNWRFSRAAAGAVSGVAVLYAIGLPWFRLVIDARPDRTMSLTAAFMVMLPYLVGDVVKALAAASLVKALKPLLVNYLPVPAPGSGSGV
jgi:biotin transport system substrate-specific component